MSRKIVKWPDGDTCELEDLENMNWKSDDYEIVEVEDDE